MGLAVIMLGCGQSKRIVDDKAVDEDKGLNHTDSEPTRNMALIVEWQFDSITPIVFAHQYEEYSSIEFNSDSVNGALDSSMTLIQVLPNPTISDGTMYTTNGPDSLNCLISYDWLVKSPPSIWHTYNSNSCGISNYSFADPGIYSIQLLASNSCANLICVEGDSMPVANAPYRLFNNYKYRYNLTLPSIMRINETSVVEVVLEVYELNQFGECNDNYSQINRLSDDVRLTLFSSGFEIEPTTSIHLEANSTLPATFVWTIRPKSEGHHYLILDASNHTAHDLSTATENLVMNHWNNQDNVNTVGLQLINTEQLFAINGSSLARNNIKKVPIEIEVRNIYGISGIAEGLIKGLIALIGFLLMYPSIQQFLSIRGHRECN